MGVLVGQKGHTSFSRCDIDEFRLPPSVDRAKWCGDVHRYLGEFLGMLAELRLIIGINSLINLIHRLIHRLIS